jgi:hypothetical protein
MSMRSQVLIVLPCLLLGFYACSDDNNTTGTGGTSGAGATGGTSGIGGTSGTGGTSGIGGTSGTGGATGGSGGSGGTGGTSGTGGATGGSGGAGIDGGATDGGAGDGGPAATFTQVYAIITMRCMPCHTTAAGIGVTNGHLDMTSKMAAFTNLVNTPAAGVACAGKGTRVMPGMPDSSIMYLKISLDDPAPCGAKMPLGLPPLPQSEADTIESWIMGGAPNN